MTCAGLVRSIDALLDGELPVRRRRRMARHVLRCEQCRGRLARAAQVLDLCRQLGQTLPADR